MGQISILTPEQKTILDGIRTNDFIRENFYFTGGTALSEFYLHHRYSEDIDIFSEKKFDPQIIISFMDSLSEEYHFKYQVETIETVNMFFLDFGKEPFLKIDFNNYSYKRVEKSILQDGIYVDSLLDIAINKLSTIIRRTDIKDFVDLYYLEPQFGLWDLIEGVRIKFHQEIEAYNLSSDFLKVEDFETLPKMIKPLTLDKIKNFFREKAKELGRTAVEP
ncbi:MAG: nucleotidyl transferase AbiEii/AbiGii toxin family protein [Patescibacteria group bacterium]|nr:nucleotidyl transferase AbiEii/AbiGii toxin family protein [Patescibacteria group bacterium]MCL5095658.1 nucleotidyl transferase AbiEii/AbiGii toxin family protein [Patescibacteria group bacterium]